MNGKKPTSSQRDRRRGPRKTYGGSTGPQDRIAEARRDIAQMIAEMGLSNATPGEVAQKVTKETFKEHGLYGTLQHIFNGSPYAALKTVYPELEPWEMKHVPMSFWMGDEGREHAREATRWLITKVGLSGLEPVDVANQVDYYTFEKAHLKGMLYRVYNGSPYAALADIYPELQAWERAFVPRDYWQGKQGRARARQATLQMLQRMSVNKAPVETIAREVNQQTFAEHGLGGMLSQVYGSSPYLALHDILPDLKPWLMGQVPRGYWQGREGQERAREAVRWMLEQLNLDVTAPPDVLAKHLKRRVFANYELDGMLQVVYNSRIQDAIADVTGCASS